LKWLSKRSEVSKLAGLLGLRRVLKNSYYHWMRPAGAVMPVAVGGVSARFYVRTYRELRMLDPVDSGEQTVLDLLVNFLQEGDVFYDIGASFGLYSVLLAQVVGGRGKVIAFEPETQSRLNLLENLKLNGLANVRCLQKALGEEPGEVKLFVSDGSSVPTLLATTSHGGGTPPAPSEMVKVDSGDRLVAEENFPIPRAVKIDVEGYEHSVIKGLSQTLAQPACELVCCEIHPPSLPAGVDTKSVLDLIQSLGFTSIDKGGREREDNFYFIARKPDVTTR
jgi:FkbM family methyltransferase